MSNDNRYHPPLDFPEDAYMERPVEVHGCTVEALASEPREIVDQIHGRYRVEADGDGYVRIPDPEGNVGMVLRAGDVAEWLANVGDDTPIVAHSDGGPEDGPAVLFETVYCFDDPDPYLCVVVRPYPSRRPDGARRPVDLDDGERALIRRALHEANGVVAHAAEKLQVRRTTLAEKMKRYGIG